MYDIFMLLISLALAAEFHVTDTASLESALTTQEAGPHRIVLAAGTYTPTATTLIDVDLTLVAGVEGQVRLENSAGPMFTITNGSLGLIGLDIVCSGQSCIQAEGTTLLLERTYLTSGFGGNVDIGSTSRIRATQDADVTLSYSFIGTTTSTDHGAHLFVDGDLTLTDVLLYEGTSNGSGGCVDHRNGTLTIQRSRLQSCVSGTDGGALYTTGVATISDSILQDTTASAGGGAIHASDDLLLERSLLCQTTASGEGGALYWRNGDANPSTLDVDHSIFAHVTASGDGGGIRAVGRNPGRMAITLDHPTFFDITGNTGVCLDTTFDQNQDSLYINDLIADGIHGLGGGNYFFARHGGNGGSDADIVNGHWGAYSGIGSFPLAIDYGSQTTYSSNVSGIVDSDCTPTNFRPDADSSALGAFQAGGIVDTDGDGWVGAEDCDETGPNAALRHRDPEAYATDAVCDGIDDDCDERIDEDAPPNTTWYLDLDGDGHGDPNAPLAVCDQWRIEGYVPSSDDCDDADPSVHPGAPELCDGLDQDCDGTADQGLATSTWYQDLDGDGHAGNAVQSCGPFPGLSPASTDCDENDVAIHADAPEMCNGIDDDCDGSADDGLATQTYYYDADGDGSAGSPVQACGQLTFSATEDDCDDNDSTVHPGAVDDTCDARDDDCDGLLDEDTLQTPWFRDADADGYGDGADSVLSCGQPGGYVAVDGDCDPLEPSAHPAAAEDCYDGVDNDCDGTVDNPSVWYPDLDEDGYGEAGQTLMQCGQPDGFALLAGDCDDANAAVNPGMEEVCNEVDDDCEPTNDIGPGLWYADQDGDGYGSTPTDAPSCEQPAGFVAEPGDCDDADAAVNPGMEEVCNEVDDDCDPSNDLEPPVWYADLDGDGYGDPASPQAACDQPADHVSNDQDCSPDFADPTNTCVLPVPPESGCGCSSPGSRMPLLSALLRRR